MKQFQPLVLACVFTSIAVVAFAETKNPQPMPLAITDVTVIDGTGSGQQSGMTLVVRDGHIAALSKSQQARLPKDVKVVSGHGQFLIPGLWNMHLHAVNYEEGKKRLGSLLSYGITGVRDMGAPLDDILRLRSEIRSGDVLGPKLVVCGPLLQGPIPIRMPLLIALRDETEARDTVRMLKERGVDFIKVHDSIPHDMYLAIADEAKRQRLPLAGHLPPTVSAREASDAGQASVEHLGGAFFGELVAFSNQEEELQRQRNLTYSNILSALDRKEKPVQPQFRAAFADALVQDYDDKKASELFARFRRNNTWQCPTLVTMRSLWESNKEDQMLNDDDLAAGVKVFDKLAEVVGAMQKAGVRILAGTDGPYAQGGAALHDELEALAKAGLTPMQTLQAATRNPAEFLDQLNSCGTIQVGKYADFVLLEENPLENIRNTRRIAAVVRGGVLFTKTELETMREEQHKK